MMSDFTMADAAFPGNLNGTDFTAVAGYFGGPNADNVWSHDEWSMPGPKLPIWVGGYGGAAEGLAAVRALESLKVPKGSYTVIDLEGRIDHTYLDHYGRILQAAEYKVWVYGSASSVFGNQPLNGYWVADYAGIGPFMYNGPSVRATQYASGNLYDYSLVKEWTLSGFWT